MHGNYGLLERLYLHPELHDLLMDFFCFMSYLWWPEVMISPCFFFFGYRSWSCLPYTILALCYFVVTWGKIRSVYMLRRIIDLLIGWTDGPLSLWRPAFENLRQVKKQRIDGRDSVPLLGWELPWPTWVSTAIKTIPNYADLPTSAMAAGASWLAWDRNANESWRESWEPIVGAWAAQRTSLPLVLLMLLANSLVLHIGGFLRGMRQAKKNLMRLMLMREHDIATSGVVIRDAYLAVAYTFMSTTNAADAANLLLVAVVTFEMGRALDDSYGAERTTRFFLKVLLGTAPRLWFKVSSLQHLFHSLGHGGRRSVIIAVLMTLYATADPMLIQFSYLRNAFRTRQSMMASGLAAKRQNARELFPAWKLCIGSVSFLASLVAILGSVVRLAGVWFCDSHVFQLSTASCMPLP